MLNLKKILTKKSTGNVTSLIFGQMFMLLLIIWCLFAFRLYVLNTVFNYVDDSLTSSLLGGALVNVEEYGKSNQLIIHNNEEWIDKEGNADTKGWERAEADILLSELNFGSDITLNHSALENKKILDTNNRYSYNLAMDDRYLKQSVSAFVGNMNYNLTNGLKPSTYSSSNHVANVSGIGALAGGTMKVPFDNLVGTLVSTAITSDINITRYEIYNVWKANLALKHYYQSEWLTWNGDNYAWVDSDNAPLPLTDEQFELWFTRRYYPTAMRGNAIDITSASSPANPDNENYGQYVQDMERKRIRWEIDLTVRNSGQPLICYTNTQTTYQGDYNKERIAFNYFFADDSGHTNIDSLYNDQALEITDTRKAPIAGYSVYSYSSDADGSNISTTYTRDDGLTDLNTTTVELKNGKMAGALLENTSLYAEITFKVKTFPGSLYENLVNDKEVTIARLIDIELNDEGNGN